MERPLPDPDDKLEVVLLDSKALDRVMWKRWMPRLYGKSSVIWNDQLLVNFTN